MLCDGTRNSSISNFQKLIIDGLIQLYDNPVRYDDKCGDTPTCEVTFENLNLKAPVYMYYKLDNFYQNHRR